MIAAIITGVQGQVGSYLAEHLLKKGYTVYGIVHSKLNLSNLDDCIGHPGFFVIQADISDFATITNLIRDIRPNFFYNLAAKTNVADSFSSGIDIYRINTDAVINQLEAIKLYSSHTRYVQASTSEIIKSIPYKISENNITYEPRSPYAISKCAAHMAVRYYRTTLGLHASNFIGFNQESSRRGLNFFTRKVSHTIAKISLGLEKHIKLGNIDFEKDMCSAIDSAAAYSIITDQDTGNDYIVSSGRASSGRHIAEYVAEKAGLTLADILIQDLSLIRPNSVNCLLGDSSRLKSLGWSPRYICIENILDEMFAHDYFINKEIK